MEKALKTIAAGIGAYLYLSVLGCGNPGLSEASAPRISQIFPQAIAAGTPSQIIKVMGNNFTSQAAVLWNGRALPTTVVDSNTLTGAVEGSNLAAPTTVQLQVQNLQNGEQSQPVPVTVTASATSANQLAIGATALPGATANQPYTSTLNAVGGTLPYTWSITSGQLPAGVSLVSSTGAISGIPIASGTFSFTATVVDSGSPKQTISATISIPVASSQSTATSSQSTATSSQLTIMSPQLPSGSVGTAYSIPLQASGGTPAYAWSITSGSLPSGLGLSASSGVISGTPTANGGVISGTPTANGTFNFTIGVADSSNPAGATSTPASITVGSSQLAITSSTLSSGTVGTAYSTLLQASGGTPAYTWSIMSGSLPAGLTLAATSGVISGTPATAGTSQFTAAVTDNSNPAQTQLATISLTVSGAQQPTGPGTTWYVRPDGGTRYSSNVTAGQCDGMADAPYSGSGVNQHCAFNDVRMLYTDGSYADWQLVSRMGLGDCRRRYGDHSWLHWYGRYLQNWSE